MTPETLTGSLTRMMSLQAEIEEQLNAVLDKDLTKERETELSNKIQDQLEIIAERLDAGKSLALPGHLIFKELFAHKYCYLLLEGLSAAFGKSNLFTSEEMVITSNGEPVHYLLAITYGLNKYYVDAYGIHSDLADVVNRYQLPDIEAQVFDSQDDSNPYAEPYRDACLALLDDAETMLEERLEEVDAGTTFDYLDHFYLLMTLKLFEGITAN